MRTRYTEFTLVDLLQVASRVAYIKYILTTQKQTIPKALCRYTLK